MTFKPGDKVEYAAHPVSWQAGHNETPLMHHQADGRKPLAALVSAEDAAALSEATGTKVEPVDEDWRPATVVAQPDGSGQMEHPAMPHLNKFEPDIVVKLAPDDGSPPFDLNVLLVRRRPRRSRRR